MQALGGVVDLGDLPASFVAVDAARVAAIDQLLRGLLPHPGPPQLVVRYQRRRPAAPRRRPTHAYTDARVWHDGDELVVHLDDDGAGARVTPDVAQIGGDGDDLDRSFQRLFHFAVTHLLAHHQRWVLHAAALVSDDGRSHLVLGPTGRGKSTLALAGVASGWGLLGDDLVVVRVGERGLEAAGIARRVALPGDLGATLSVPTPLIAGDQRGRRELGVDSLSRGWFPVAGVVEVDHSASPDGELHELDGEHAMYRVLGSFASVTDPRLLPVFFPVAGALCQLPTWRVGHGANAATRLRVASQLLDRLVVS